MRLLLFSFVLLFLFSFSHAQMDCAELERMCVESACMDAGGEYSGDSCIHGEEFEPEYYQNATGECATLKEQCEETRGFFLPPRNASCCGPVFALLFILGFAVASRFK